MTVRQGLNIIAGNEVLPTGTIVPYAGATAPDGFLLCDGSAVSRTTYSALFSVIGTTYGEGDGNSTFNLPDLDFLLKGVKGNGISLGLTDGTNYTGLNGQRVANNLNVGLVPYTNFYGVQVGTSSGGNGDLDSNKAAGITSDSTKSGIESVIDTNTNYIIKY